MYDKMGLFIDGEWRDRSAGGTLEISDPATGEVIGASPSASKDDGYGPAYRTPRRGGRS